MGCVWMSYCKATKGTGFFDGGGASSRGIHLTSHECDEMGTSCDRAALTISWSFVTASGSRFRDAGVDGKDSSFSSDSL